jgi:nucleoside-diphosphate-sugar epimerase
LDEGYRVKVLDTYWFGRDVLKPWRANKNLIEIQSDLRDTTALKSALAGCTDVIHLACISNDPSYELDPDLGRSINYEAFGPLIDLSAQAGVSRFIYASSSSVYGVKEEDEVTEELSLEPLTDYSKYKAMCEPELLRIASQTFVPVVLRPATVCGYSPRLRLDLTVNILTNHAVNKGEITVFGGSQTRPNIHIADVCSAYSHLLKAHADVVSGQIFNVGCENLSLNHVAEIVRNEVDPRLDVVHQPTDDIRSYRISSKRISQVLNFKYRHSVNAAIRDLMRAFKSGLVPESLNRSVYFNIDRMRELLSDLETRRD